MREQFITTTYGKLKVYQKGTGDRKLVLLHGAGCDNAMLSWREVMEKFPDDSYTVYAPDLLGHGESDYNSKTCGPNFYQIHIACVKELVENLGLERFVLAGLSMGGAIAIGYTLQNPGKVQALFPVDSWGLAKKIPFHRISNWFVQKTNFTVWQYRMLIHSKMLAKWSVSYALIGDKRKITDALVEEVMRACTGNAAGRSMQEFQRSSLTSEGAIPYYVDSLQDLSMPVVFLNGEKDSLVTPSISRNAADKVRNGKYIELKGCKHWSVKEKPEQFAALVEESFY